MSKDSNEDKIKRDAFLYLEPSEKSYGDPDVYAHCSTCFMWTGKDRERCYILGKKLVVRAEDTCCVYVNGEPETDRAGHEKELATPEQVGFYKHRPQCKRCYWFGMGMCGLFVKLNLEWPEYFDLDVSVKGNGCCNSFTPKDGKFENESFIALLNKKVSVKDFFKLS